MNGTELRSFSDLQILTKITYTEIGRNLQIAKSEVCLHSL